MIAPEHDPALARRLQLRREIAAIALMLVALFVYGALAFQPATEASCFAARW